MASILTRICRSFLFEVADYRSYSQHVIEVKCGVFPRLEDNFVNILSFIASKSIEDDIFRMTDSFGFNKIQSKVELTMYERQGGETPD
jgi:hypothetical protein